MSIWVGPIVSVKQHPRSAKTYTPKPQARKEPKPSPVLDEKSTKSEKPDQNKLETKAEKEEKVRSLNKKRVDFVIVYRKSTLTDDSITKIETFLLNLEQKGFELEISGFSVNTDIDFVKIHAPTRVLLQFAELFGIELAYHYKDYRVGATKPFNFMATILTSPNVMHPVYERARPILSEDIPRTITNAEKGLVIYRVLSKNPYGESDQDCGIKKLISTNIFESAFPIHDGQWQWTEEGPLNERQLLDKYWSSLRCFYKQQPLDLIHKYYGPETSFYFAWLGYYNTMLIPASALGVFCFILGLLIFEDIFTARSKEVCESPIMLCPQCHFKNCKFEPLKNSCFHAHLIYLMDNPLVITFAGLMSIWSTFFLELWRRKEAMLQIRWNLRSVEADCSMRPQFEAKTTHYKISKITGNLEPYMPKKVQCARYTLSASAILFLMLLMILGMFGIMVYIKTVAVVLTSSDKHILTINPTLVASASGSFLSLCFILIFEMLYGKIATWLTDLENPRTQVDYDNSFTYKSYALAFVNNYAVIFYIAFVKARFYTHPGDERLWTTAGGIGSDLCNPAGCIIELGIHLVTILIGKQIVLTGKQYIIPKIKNLLRRMRKHKNRNLKVTLQWESDYLLNPYKKYHIMQEYMQMIIQYGFVTFFVAAFPPAPLLALFNNLIELRIDAIKMTRAFRRPVAFKVPNLAAWNGILKGVTYIGVATNAFVIAFTSEFVQRNIYKTTVSSDLVGFVNTTISVFNVSEFLLDFGTAGNLTVCYYPGRRYPPDHPSKYELTEEHWYILTIRFLAVVVFEHIVMLITGIIAYIIPDIPFSVKEHINYQRDQFKAIKLKALQETYLKEQEKKKLHIFDLT
ncbi:anoctamin-6-like isoform X1 [Tribolium madens]|uniref:anoctamin-6-like isoform X1 n=1 Tax=Tribolium madens TaxID=41895 RepID=UPI001CF766FF|nr:anoctamin-6-like isoform X1 [Tribolium madens]